MYRFMSLVMTDFEKSYKQTPLCKNFFKITSWIDTASIGFEIFGLDLGIYV